MSEAEKRSKRSHYHVSAVRVPQVAIVVFVLMLAGRAAAFTQVSPPFTAASDFITGFPTCLNLPFTLETLGPLGVLFDGAHFFVNDPCIGGGTTYRFTAAGGSASTPDAQVANGLFEGLTLKGGVYYGNGFSAMYKFDPTTLSTIPVVNLPFLPAGLAGQPGTTNIWSGDLNIGGVGGLFLVSNPNSASPSVTELTNGACFDGIAFTADGTKFYAAICGSTLVFVLDLTTSAFSLVDTSHPVMACQAQDTDCADQGVDGIAVALNNTTLSGIDVSNNVFVNDHDGTLVRIDVNNGNAVSVVASGGSRGDFTTVGPDNCLYVTQSDRVEKMSPCFFQVSFSNKCPLTQGFWKNRPAAWPVTSLVLGSQSYTQSQLQAILKTPVGGDASLILADQLIAAKLSIASDSNPASVAATVSDADSLLAAQSGRLPYGIKASSTTGQAMVNDANILNSYNNGALTLSCTP
jgi:hypothetical protein